MIKAAQSSTDNQEQRRKVYTRNRHVRGISWTDSSQVKTITSQDTVKQYKNTLHATTDSTFHNNFDQNLSPSQARRLIQPKVRK